MVQWPLGRCALRQICARSWDLVSSLLTGNAALCVCNDARSVGLTAGIGDARAE